jgi:hypothetical protein
MAEIYVHGEEDEILRAIRDKLKRGGCVRLIAEHADDNGGTPSPLTEFGRWFVTNGGILLVQRPTSHPSRPQAISSAVKLSPRLRALSPQSPRRTARSSRCSVQVPMPRP